MDTKFLFLKAPAEESEGELPTLVNMSLLSNQKVEGEAVQFILLNNVVTVIYNMIVKEQEAQFYPEVDKEIIAELNPTPPTLASDAVKELIDSIGESSYTTSVFEMPSLFAYNPEQVEQLIADKQEALNALKDSIEKEFIPLKLAVKEKEQAQLKSCEDAECSPEQIQAIQDAAAQSLKLIANEEDAATAKGVAAIDALPMQYELLIPSIERVEVS